VLSPGHSPGELKVAALFSPEPILLSDVEAAVARGARDADSLSTALWRKTRQEILVTVEEIEVLDCGGVR